MSNSSTTQQALGSKENVKRVLAWVLVAFQRGSQITAMQMSAASFQSG